MAACSGEQPAAPSVLDVDRVQWPIASCSGVHVALAAAAGMTQWPIAACSGVQTGAASAAGIVQCPILACSGVQLAAAGVGCCVPACPWCCADAEPAEVHATPAARPSRKVRMFMRAPPPGLLASSRHPCGRADDSGKPSARAHRRELDSCVWYPAAYPRCACGP